MAVLLYAKNVRVAFGERTLLDIDELTVRDRARIGLVGMNGAGKSTLLSVLSGERTPDSGQIQRNCACAVVHQFGCAPDTAASGAAFARLHAGKTVHEGISGGEMERIRLARALEAHTPLLFADEPTSHLDFEGRKQLETLLRAHDGALVLVSHDRALLDALCNEIWSLQDGKIRVFPGNYTAFRQQEKRERDFALQEYRAYTQEKARLTGLLSGVREDARHVRKAPKRMGNSEARLQKASARDNAQEKLQNRAVAIKSRIRLLEEKERPAAEQQVTMELFARGGVTSAQAIRVNRLTLRIGDQILLKNAAFTVPTGQRTAIVGENGCGKTTLLRYILSGGYGVKIAPGVKIGYFSQDTMQTLRENETLLANVQRESVLPAHMTRIILSRMGFSERDLQKEARILSGGERVRAVLCMLLASDCNVLLLDEPGNHLDLCAREALEEMLSLYQGTLLFVSHDRTFINRVAQRLILFENGRLTEFPGNLDAYEAQRTQANDRQLEREKLRMRMAELAGRLALARSEAEKAALNAEYDALIARLRAIADDA